MHGPASALEQAQHTCVWRAQTSVLAMERPMLVLPAQSGGVQTHHPTELRAQRSPTPGGPTRQMILPCGSGAVRSACA
jgi:hypothetical protein